MRNAHWNLCAPALDLTRPKPALALACMCVVQAVPTGPAVGQPLSKTAAGQERHAPFLLESPVMMPPQSNLLVSPLAELTQPLPAHQALQGPRSVPEALGWSLPGGLGRDTAHSPKHLFSPSASPSCSSGEWHLAILQAPQTPCHRPCPRRSSSRWPGMCSRRRGPRDVTSA